VTSGPEEDLIDAHSVFIMLVRIVLCDPLGSPEFEMLPNERIFN